MDLANEIAGLIDALGPIDSEAKGSEKKNYTERMSADITALVAKSFYDAGLPVTAPTGRDKTFMGGYGPKGVDAYLSDEKHGLLLSSGTKGILFAVAKNLKNRYRDMAMEALELHKRFPFAVCGHFVFLGRDAAALPSRAFGTVMGEVVALLTGIDGRERADEPSELYEEFGVMVIEPGDPTSVDLSPVNVPESMHAATYVDRMVRQFKLRNPFYFGS